MRNITIILVSIFLTYCGKQNNSDSSDSQAAVSIDVLNGTWEGPCTSKHKVTEIYASGSETRLVKDFADNDCNDLISTLTMRRTYSLSDNKIDMVWTSVALTIAAQEALDVCNSETCYNSQDWTLNVEKDITGSNENTPKKGDKQYTIFKLADGFLTLGKIDESHSGLTEATRPTEYSDMVMTKKK